MVEVLIFGIGRMIDLERSSRLGEVASDTHIAYQLRCVCSTIPWKCKDAFSAPFATHRKDSGRNLRESPQCVRPSCKGTSITWKISDNQCCAAHTDHTVAAVSLVPCVSEAVPANTT